MLDEFKSQNKALLEAIRQGWIKSAHDLSDGGLAVALAESCIINRNKPVGITVNLSNFNMRPEWFLFSESQSRILVSVAEENTKSVEDYFRGKNIPVQKIGQVGGTSLKINDWINISVEELIGIYYHTLDRIMSG